MSKSDGKKVLLFISGGVSAENQIALLSAQNVYPHLDSQHFEIVPVFIAPDGQWFALSAEQAQNWPLLREAEQQLLLARTESARVALLPTASGLILTAGGREYSIDLIFPMLHGPFGEDGTIQGLAEFFDLPVVGSDMSGSLLNMDKVLMKAMLELRGIPCARYRSFLRSELGPEGVRPLVSETVHQNYDEMGRELFELWGCPSLFVKPARMGSSVGISQVKRAGDLRAAVELALRYGENLLIEEGFCAVELELAAMELDAEKRGNILISNAASIRSGGEFYSYEQKYFPEKMERSLVVEAHNDLSAEALARAKALASLSFGALGACHYARVDLFYLHKEDRLLLNEINTIPGFTAHSMFPKLMEAEGWPMPRLVPHLLELALSQ